MRRLLLLMAFALYVFIFSSSGWSKDITYNRGTAITYAKDHYGTSVNTSYNFGEYKCCDGRKQECRADNSWLTDSMRVDCANFVSQALIAGTNGVTSSYVIIFLTETPGGV